jgi:hypothetical protein
LKKIIFLSLFIFTKLFCDQSAYTLGNGYKVPLLPLYIGGYISTEYINTQYKSDDVFKIANLALLAYGSYQGFDYLMELETPNFYTKYLDGNRSSTTNSSPHIERLYLHYDFNEVFSSRIGKFNSPVGYWNIIPINVFRATTSNPAVTSLIYPQHATGLDLVYRRITKSVTTIHTFIQITDDIEKNYNNIKVDKHYGFGIEFHPNLLSIKFNTGYFQNEIPIAQQNNLYYNDLAFLFDNDTLEISGEIANQFSKHRSTIDYALYLQSLYRITESHAAIIRIESVKKNKELPNNKDSMLLFGYTYRPIYPVACKVEYQFHSRHKENQFLMSFSVFF